jgi:hypothetical protein
MQVLEQNEERLLLALPEQQPLYAFERPLAPLRRVEPLPLRVVNRSIQKPKERRESRLERPIQRQQLAR